MTVRNKALGRTRGPWAATTLYIRGDVVSYLGALYAAKTTFTSTGTFVVANWDEVLAAPTIPAQVGGRECVSTVGAGLPSFAGRITGDEHYDSTARRLFILTGVAGSDTVTENFERPDGTVLNNVLATTGGKTWVGASGFMFIPSSPNVGNQTISGLVTQSGGTGDGHKASFLEMGDGAQEATAIFKTGLFAGALGIWFRSTGDPTNRSILNSGYFITVQAPGNANAGGAGRVAIRRGGSTGTIVYDAATPVPAAQSQVTWTFRIDSNPTNPTITILAGSAVVHTFTDSANSTPVSGNFIGLYDGDSGDPSAAFYLSIMDFSCVSTGTLAWTATEPIYLQAQLASGAVATGTHVLKPGIRVPTASTLLEVVLRCDTAPAGAPITVTVERFNNGTSQGVIATVSITAGANVGSVTGLSALMAKGDILKFNVTSVGSTTAGSDLTVSLEAR